MSDVLLPESKIAPNNDDAAAGVASVTVYSPKTGKPFKTGVLNAHDLITHCGYLREKPVVIQAETGEVKQTGVVPPVVPPAAPAAPEGPIDLTTMSKEGLVRLAKEKFDIDASPNASATDIIEMIEAEMEAKG